MNKRTSIQQVTSFKRDSYEVSTGENTTWQGKVVVIMLALVASGVIYFITTII